MKKKKRNKYNKKNRKRKKKKRRRRRGGGGRQICRYIYIYILCHNNMWTKRNRDVHRVELEKERYSKRYIAREMWRERER